LCLCPGYSCCWPQRIINERKGFIRFGVVLYRARTGPIDPSDYPSFEAFLEAVEQAWQQAWRRAYAERETCEAMALRHARAAVLPGDKPEGAALVNPASDDERTDERTLM